MRGTYRSSFRDHSPSGTSSTSPVAKSIWRRPKLSKARGNYRVQSSGRALSQSVQPLASYKSRDSEQDIDEQDNARLPLPPSPRTSRLKQLKGAFRRGHYEMPPMIQTGRTDDLDWQQEYPDWGHLKSIKGLNSYHKKFLEEHMKIKLGKKIGQGSFGTVYTCTRDLGGGREEALAVKVQSIGNFSDQNLKRSIDFLVNELEVYESLDHPNIVRRDRVVNIYDYESRFPKPVHYLIFMELMDGALSQLISYGVPERRCHYWFIQVIRGLKYMHDHNVVHLDIKPANILFTKYRAGQEWHFTFKLSDFSLSQKFAEAFIPWRDKQIGTVGFRAPEIQSGNVWMAKPADIYALGITLCRSLAGFQRPTQAVIRAARNWRPTATAATNVNLTAGRSLQMSQHLATLLTDLTRDEPTDRLSIDEVCRSSWVRQCFPDNNDIHTKL